MRTEKIKVHEEHPTHFLVSHGGGAPFAVAKNGLDEKTQEALSAHHIKCMAEGGEVTALPGADYSDYGGKDEALPDWSVGGLLGKAKDAIFPPSPDDVRMAKQRELSARPSESRGDDPANNLLSASASPLVQGPSIAEPSPAGERSRAEAATTSPAPAPGLTMPTMPALTGGPSSRELDEGQRMQADAARKQAGLTEQKSKEDYGIQDAALKQRQQTIESTSRDWQEAQRRADQTAEEVFNTKIDPNSFWHTRTEAQNSKAAIGIILSGIGSGLTGGPNLALQMLEKAAERDVDAQKANLANKHSKLAYYLQKGHSIQEARQLAVADIMDGMRGQIALSATKYAGQEAQPIAEATIGALKQATFQRRQEAFTRTLQNKNLQIELWEKQRAAALMPVQQGLMMAATQGHVLPGEARAFLPADRVVPVPGGVTLANTPKDRDELAEMQQAVPAALAATRRIEELSKKTGLGGATSREGALAVTELQNAYQSILGRSAAPRGEQEKDMAAEFGNPTNFWRTSEGTKELMKSMRGIIRKHAAAAYGARLAGGLKAAQGVLGQETD